jgi:hypothetical protein
VQGAATEADAPFFPANGVCPSALGRCFHSRQALSLFSECIHHSRYGPTLPALCCASNASNLAMVLLTDGNSARSGSTGEDMKASRREMDRAFSCPIIVRSYREEVPRVQDSKARQSCLAGQYSGHDALPADCKCPWQPKMERPLSLRSSPCDPPYLAWHTPQPQYHSRPGLFHASTEKLRECCRLSTGLEQLASSARRRERATCPEGTKDGPFSSFRKEADGSRLLTFG